MKILTRILSIIISTVYKVIMHHVALMIKWKTRKRSWETLILDLDVLLTTPKPHLQTVQHSWSRGCSLIKPHLHNKNYYDSFSATIFKFFYGYTILPHVTLQPFFLQHSDAERYGKNPENYKKNHIELIVPNINLIVTLGTVLSGPIKFSVYLIAVFIRYTIFGSYYILSVCVFNFIFSHSFFQGTDWSLEHLTRGFCFDYFSKAEEQAEWNQQYLQNVSIYIYCIYIIEYLK